MSTIDDFEVIKTTNLDEVVAEETKIIGFNNTTNKPFKHTVTGNVETRLSDLEDDKVNTADIVNDLTTGGAAVPLSAEQGKTLNTNKIETSVLENTPTDSTAKVTTSKYAYDNFMPIFTAWTNYTPTVTAAAGTPTTITKNGYYKTIGKTVFIKCVVVITDKGTASGNIIFSLPSGMTSANNISSVGSCYSVTTGDNGKARTAANATTIDCAKYENSSLWVNGYTVECTIIVEIA